MMQIKYLESHVLYENPLPHVRSRQGFFPGLVQLPSGDLLALFVVAEAFESPDGTTHVARSRDDGHSWTVEGPLYDKTKLGFETTDSFKPTVLRDGSLVAIGYRFHRVHPEQDISIAETGGILPGDDIISRSYDEGRTWTAPRVIPRSRPELLEISGPCLELRDGDLLALAGLFPLQDGTHPSGRMGVALRESKTTGAWNDSTVFYQRGNLIAYEPRVCEMEDGRLVALVWVYDSDAGVHYPNEAVVSHDQGRSWSVPIETGHWGQASSLIALGGDFLATIHAHRNANPGIFVRIIDFYNDQWRLVAERAIYGADSLPQTHRGQSSPEMFKSLRFGQPSLLRLRNGEFLACHGSSKRAKARSGFIAWLSIHKL